MVSIHDVTFLNNHVLIVIESEDEKEIIICKIIDSTTLEKENHT